MQGSYQSICNLEINPRLKPQIKPTILVVGVLGLSKFVTMMWVFKKVCWVVMGFFVFFFNFPKDREKDPLNGHLIPLVK